MAMPDDSKVIRVLPAGAQLTAARPSASRGSPSIRVTSIVIKEGPPRPYAAYEFAFRSANDWAELSAWRRWSECQDFARQLQRSMPDLPPFPTSAADLIINIFGDVRFDGNFLESRRLVLETYFRQVLPFATGEVAIFLRDTPANSPGVGKRYCVSGIGSPPRARLPPIPTIRLQTEDPTLKAVTSKAAEEATQIEEACDNFMDGYDECDDIVNDRSDTTEPAAADEAQFDNLELELGAEENSPSSTEVPMLAQEANADSLSWSSITADNLAVFRDLMMEKAQQWKAQRHAKSNMDALAPIESPRTTEGDCPSLSGLPKISEAEHSEIASPASTIPNMDTPSSLPLQMTHPRTAPPAPTPDWLKRALAFSPGASIDSPATTVLLSSIDSCPSDEAVPAYSSDAEEESAQPPAEQANAEDGEQLESLAVLPTKEAEIKGSLGTSIEVEAAAPAWAEVQLAASEHTACADDESDVELSPSAKRAHRRGPAVLLFILTIAVLVALVASPVPAGAVLAPLSSRLQAFLAVRPGRRGASTSATVPQLAPPAVVTQTPTTLLRASAVSAVRSTCDVRDFGKILLSEAHNPPPATPPVVVSDFRAAAPVAASTSVQVRAPRAMPRVLEVAQSSAGVFLASILLAVKQVPEAGVEYTQAPKPSRVKRAPWRRMVSGASRGVRAVVTAPWKLMKTLAKVGRRPSPAGPEPVAH